MQLPEPGEAVYVKAGRGGKMRCTVIRVMPLSDDPKAAILELQAPSGEQISRRGGSLLSRPDPGKE